MKKKLYTFFVLCCIGGSVFGQNSPTNIVDDLNAPKDGQGEVRIFQDESLEGSIAMPRTGNTDQNGNLIAPTQHQKTRVYKIQIFSGNNQSQSKQEALSKQAQIRNSYPELHSVISSDPPVWRLRVGNFDTQEEATDMMRELKANFPAFGREMYIVTERNKPAR